VSRRQPVEREASGAEEAASAAELYRRVRRARGREIDLAIAACALTHDAPLWTLNVEDFEDIEDLRLFSARGPERLPGGTTVETNSKSRERRR
jgi:predicted nucleic acid-binding protein